MNFLWLFWMCDEFPWIKANPITKHIKICEEILYINRFVNTKFLKIISALRFSIFFIWKKILYNKFIIQRSYIISFNSWKRCNEIKRISHTGGGEEWFTKRKPSLDSVHSTLKRSDSMFIPRNNLWRESHRWIFQGSHRREIIQCCKKDRGYTMK